MKRLTKKWSDNPAVPVNINYDFLLSLDKKTADGVQAIVDRLAAYEDTGLMPEQIEKAMEDCADTFAENQFAICEINEMGGIDHLRNLTQAEKDGHLAMLPCKVGDTVWANKTIVGDRYKSSDRPYQIEVVFVGLGERTGFFHGQDLDGRVFPFDFGQVGKTVFLTRAEAVAVLERRGAENNEAD